MDSEERDYSGFDPSTWAKQPRLLARNDADAALVRYLVLMLLVDALVVPLVLITTRFLPYTWRDFVWPFVTLLCVETVGVFVVWFRTYAYSLQRMNRAARWATWRREVELGIDLDGDGYVGEPQALEPITPIGHEVKVPGQEPVVIPDLSVPAAGGHVPLQGFPPEWTANDVLALLQRAYSRVDGRPLGFGYRDWEGYQLPSGAVISRATWTQAREGLVSWGLAQAAKTPAGKRQVMPLPGFDGDRITRLFHDRLGVRRVGIQWYLVDEGEDDDDLYLQKEVENHEPQADPFASGNVPRSVLRRQL